MSRSKVIVSDATSYGKILTVLYILNSGMQTYSIFE